MRNLKVFGWLSGVATSLLIPLIFVVSSARGDELKLSDCPVAVQKTLQREANGAEIEEVESETEDGETTYGAEVTFDGKEYKIVVAEDGTLIEKVLDETEEIQVLEIDLSDCPAAVQKTLKREANGGEIKAVDKETKDGKAIYEIDVKIDGKNYEIRIGEDGILISKALDEEEE